MGIEPTFSAWEADVLPLNYTRAERDSMVWGHFDKATQTGTAPPCAGQGKRTFGECALLWCCSGHKFNTAIAEGLFPGG